MASRREAVASKDSHGGRPPAGGRLTEAAPTLVRTSGRRLAGCRNLPPAGTRRADRRAGAYRRSLAARHREKAPHMELLYGAIGQHRVVSIAAAVTFFALLAMFPAVAALVSIYGIFADPGTIRVHLDDLASVLPSGAIEVIGDQLTRVASGGKTTLGATFLFTLGLSLWSANAGMKALFDALN